MKKIQTLIAVMFIVAGAAAQTTWTIEKDISNIGFKVAHFGVTQRTGYFRVYDAKIISASEDFAGASVTFSAQTASVFTDNEQRDKHLRSEAFFNAEKYPTLQFTGTLVKQGDNYALKGNLTIRDITKPVSFAVVYGGRMKDDTFHIVKAGFKITGTINRLDFGLKWDEKFETGDPIVGEKVDIEVNAEFDKQ